MPWFPVTAAYLAYMRVRPAAQIFGSRRRGRGRKGEAVGFVRGTSDFRQGRAIYHAGGGGDEVCRR